ncbi:hypothetical protein HPB51_026068 [Rhipicephalus microplus]|uniref:Uncharacterized protein n=1 Tax=Rhipicephalus microplus TaxID=6941 RepID=A0A9J6EE86_RHIMP|nr:hypothetical protein HPB51_026068 [Rhipicephalus microplus]
MADVVESTRFEVELQDSAGLLSKQAGSPYIRDRKAIDAALNETALSQNAVSFVRKTPRASLGVSLHRREHGPPTHRRTGCEFPRLLEEPSSSLAAAEGRISSLSACLCLARREGVESRDDLSDLSILSGHQGSRLRGKRQ